MHRIYTLCSACNTHTRDKHGDPLAIDYYRCTGLNEQQCPRCRRRLSGAWPEATEIICARETTT